MLARKTSRPQPLSLRRKSNPTTSESATPSIPSASSSKQQRRTPAYYGIERERHICSLSESGDNTDPKRLRLEKPVIWCAIKEDNAPPPLERTDFRLPIVSQPDRQNRPF